MADADLHLAETPASSPQVFFSGTRSFRSPKFLVMMALIVMASIFFWRGVFLRGSRQTGTNNIVIVIATFLSLFIFVGARRAIAGEIWQLVISTNGVRYGHDFWTWSHVRSVRGSRNSFSSKYVMSVRIGGNTEPSDTPPAIGVTPHATEIRAQPSPQRGTVELLIDQPPSRDECARVISQLATWLHTNHPRVQVKGP